jgi:murein DD-endopeptidase MepM/ murein hydrolase activator NlpD
MNFKKTICLFIAALTLTATAQELRSVSAHDNMHSNLLASQRNIQDQVKTMETKAFMDIIMQEEEEPEIDIYTESWNSQAVNPYAGMDVADNIRIDVSEYSMPVPGYITSPYGYRKRFRRQHKGVDLKLHVGDTVRAAFSGKVRLTRYDRRGYGYYVIVRHHNGLETVYGHLSKFLVKPNQDIKVGEPIALGGNTGRSTGPHLHFETRYMGYPINPMAILTSLIRQHIRISILSQKELIHKQGTILQMLMFSMLRNG